MKHVQVKKLTLLSSIATLAALLMMAASIIAPRPLVLVVAMSLGQGVAILSLALYLLAIALDLQTGGGSYEAAIEESREIADDDRP